MFGVDQDAPAPISQHRLVWPLGIMALGIVISMIGGFIFLGGVMWIAPLSVGPSLTVMGFAGLFLPGVTGAIGFDWSPYEAWQVYLGAAWFALTTVLPLLGAAALVVVSWLL